MLAWVRCASWGRGGEAEIRPRKRKILRRLGGRSAACRPPAVTTPLLWGGMLLLASSLHAAEISKATTSRAAREDAIAEIPFAQLDEATQAKLWRVVAKPSIYRRMPLQLVDCDADLYLFLVRYPEVIVNVWDLMGVTNVAVQRVGPFTFDAADGSGTVSRVELVYGTADTHVLYAEGTYTGPLTKKKLDGRCVLILKSGYMRDHNNRVMVSSRLDLFVQLDQIGAEILAKTLHPLVGRSADFNFAESTGFMGRISRQAERSGPGVSQLAAQLTKVDPAVRQRFAQLAAAVSHKAVLRAAGASQPLAVAPSSATTEWRPALEATSQPASSPTILR